MNIFEKTKNKIKNTEKNIKDTKKINPCEEEVKKIKKKTEEYVTEGKNKVNKFFNNIKKQIKEKPTTSILIAGIIGFLTGLMFNRNNK